MKIVFSRKGFDTKNGGVPSPILPDGRLCSLPIPDEASQIKYRDISCGDLNLGHIVEQLTKRKTRSHHKAHLDPDLNAEALPRKKGWTGIFGPGGAAITHLNNHEFGEDDLFLFFGWFRETEWHDGILRYIRTAPHLHVLFGWLQVGRIVPARKFTKTDRTWADYHPHFHRSRLDWAEIHVGRDSLCLPINHSPLHGFGVFPAYRDNLRLTAPKATRSIWRLPQWFHPNKRKALSCHADGKWWQKSGDWVNLTTVPIGQEFVLDCDEYPESIGWLAEILGVADLATAK